MEKLHPKAVYLLWLETLTSYGLLVIIIFGGFAIWMVYRLQPFLAITGKEPAEPVFFWNVFWFIFLIFLIFVGSYIWAKLCYRFYLYEFTEDAVKIEHGVIHKRYISIPYERIQNVDIHRSLWDRILGLSDLQIQTAGYAGYIRMEGRIPGILPEEAERLREYLIKKVKGAKQGL